MESFEYGYRMTGTADIGSSGKTRRSRSDNRNLLSGIGSNRRNRCLIIFPFPIRNKAFQSADCNRLIHRFMHFADGTYRLALFFLRAYAAADSGEQVRRFNRIDSGLKISLLNTRDKFGDGDADRTALYAGAVLTV